VFTACLFYNEKRHPLLMGPKVELSGEEDKS